MANLQQEEFLRDLAGILEVTLKEAYNGKIGFMLTVAPFGSGEGVSDYIGNISRESGILLLRETADRLEKNQTIPASEGLEQ